MRNFQNGLRLPRELRVKSVISPTVVHDQLYITQELSAAMILVSYKRNSLVTSKYLHHTNMNAKVCVCVCVMICYKSLQLLDFYKLATQKKIKEIDLTIK